MNIKESLEFLANHQPMPNDLDVTQEECDQFMASLELFQNTKDIRCIPLFINCISENTGMGMYEIISDVLINQDRDSVIESLKLGLQSADDSIKYRCCWWALDLDAWELEYLIKPLTASNNVDLKDASEAYIELASENV